MIRNMNKIVAMLVALVATLFTVNALAYTPPPSPAPASWISDTSHVLSDDAHARLDAKLRQINQSSANEIAALILPTLDGADVADVGDITAKTWGVGKKGLDNGVLVVLAMKEHKSRISTGKGVEGDLPDLKANDILVQARPYLRKNDVEGALGFIFDSSAKAIANHKAELAAGKSHGGSSQPSCDVSGVGASSGSGLGLIFVVAIAGLLVWMLAASAKARREREAREREAAKQRQEARRRLVEEREAARKRDEERQRKAALTKNTPVVAVPAVPRPTYTPPVTVPRPSPTPPRPTPSVAPAVAAAAAATLAADAAEKARRKREQDEADARRARERADEDRRRRERDEEDRRRRDREEEDRRSSYSSSSSSSSFDWGGSSSDSGSFGGGDSGGGGSSGDW